MRQNREAFEITVNSAPSQTKIGAIFDEFRYRRMAIPRNPGMHGMMTYREALELQLVSTKLAEEIGRSDVKHSPIDTNGQIVPGSITIRKTQRGSGWGEIFSRFGLSRDVTSAYNLLMQYGDHTPQPQAKPTQHFIPAQTTVDYVGNAIAARGYYASKRALRSAISQRAEVIEASMRNEGKIERGVEFLAWAGVSILNLGTRFVRLDLHKLADDVAVETEMFQAETGRKGEVGIPGMVLGGLEIMASGVEDAVGGPLGVLADSVTDLAVGEVYDEVKFRGRGVFGHRPNLPAIKHTLEIAGAIPWLPTTLTLLMVQKAGKRELRKDIVTHTPRGADILGRIAAEQTVLDYVVVNGDRTRRARRFF